MCELNNHQSKAAELGVRFNLKKKENTQKNTNVHYTTTNRFRLQTLNVMNNLLSTS